MNGFVNPAANRLKYPNIDFVAGCSERGLQFSDLVDISLKVFS